MSRRGFRGIITTTSGGSTSGSTETPNSLVLHDISHPTWEKTPTDSPVKFRVAYRNDATYGPVGIINPNGDATSRGARGVSFGVPAGTTTTTAKLIARLDDGDVGTEKLVLAFYNSGTPFFVGATPVASLVCTLTSSWQTFSLPASLTAGNTYIVSVAANDAVHGGTAQAKGLIQSLTVTSDTTTGLLSGSYVRFDGNPELNWDHVHTDYLYNFVACGSYERAVFDTNANSFVVEAHDIGPSTSTYNTYAVVVNGEPINVYAGPGTTSGTNLRWFQTVDLSRFQGMKRVEIVFPRASSNDASSLNPDGGEYPQAFYFPASSSTTRVMQPDAPLRIAIDGDSIVAGYGATNPPISCAAMMLRRRWRDGAQVRMFAVSGGGLSMLGSTVAARVAYVRKVCKTKPDLYYFAYGTNDWGLSLMTSTVFEQRLSSLIEQFYIARPEMAIIIQTPIPRNTQATPNSNGEVLSTFQAAAMRVAKCHTENVITVIDGSAQTVNLFDGLHPSDDPGQMQMFNFMLPAIENIIRQPGTNSQ